MRAQLFFAVTEARQVLGKVAAIGKQAKGIQNVAKIVASSMELISLAVGLPLPIAALASTASNTKRFYRITVKPCLLLDAWVGETPFWREKDASLLKKIQIVVKTANSCIKIIDTPIFAALHTITWLPVAVVFMQARFGLSMANSALKVYKLYQDFQSIGNLAVKARAFQERWTQFKQQHQAENLGELEQSHGKQMVELRNAITTWVDEHESNSKTQSIQVAKTALKSFCETLEDIDEGQEQLKAEINVLREALDDESKGQDEKFIWKKLAAIEFRGLRYEQLSENALRKLLLRKETRPAVEAYPQDLQELIALLYQLEDEALAYVLIKTHEKEGHKEALQAFYVAKWSEANAVLADLHYQRNVTILDGSRQITQISLSAIGLVMSFVNPFAAGAVLLVHEFSSGVFGLTKVIYANNHSKSGV